MSYTTECHAAGRHILPDMTRAFAVVGIVLVNVAYFAWPGEVTYSDGGLNTSWDHTANFGVNALFLFKSYSLFSLMFGVGLAYQIKSAKRRGLPFGRRYSRRLLGLFILGMFHVTFAFVGDILIIYAIMGAFLYLFRNRPTKSLIRWSVSLIVIQVLIIMLGAIALYLGEVYDPEGLAEMDAEARAALPLYYEAYGSGTFREVIDLRWHEWTEYLIYAGPIQMPGVLAFFMLGLALVKSDLIANPSAPLWSKARHIALPIGLTLSLIAAGLLAMTDNQLSSTGLFAMMLVIIGSPFATFGYLGWLAQWAAGPDTAFRTFIARGGTATLTAYLLQSIILSLVFTGYGLGFYGDIGAAGCIAIALATGIFTLIFSSLWRKKFARGPFEFLLPKFTYWGAGR